MLRTDFPTKRNGGTPPSRDFLAVISLTFALLVHIPAAWCAAPDPAKLKFYAAIGTGDCKLIKEVAKAEGLDGIGSREWTDYEFCCELSSRDIERLIPSIKDADLSEFSRRMTLRIRASSSPDAFSDNSRLAVLLKRTHPKSSVVFRTFGLFLDMGDAESADQDFVAFAGSGPYRTGHETIREQIEAAKKDPTFVRDFRFNRRPGSSIDSFMKAFRSWAAKYPESHTAEAMAREIISYQQRFGETAVNEAKKYRNERLFKWSTTSDSGCESFRKSLPKSLTGDSLMIKALPGTPKMSPPQLIHCAALSPGSLEINRLGTFVVQDGQTRALGPTLTFVSDDWLEGQDVYRSTDTSRIFPLSDGRAWIVHRHSRDKGGEVGARLTIAHVYRVDSSSVAFAAAFEGSRAGDGGELWTKRHEFSVDSEGRMHVKEVREHSDENVGSKKVEVSSSIWTASFVRN